MKKGDVEEEDGSQHWETHFVRNAHQNVTRTTYGNLLGKCSGPSSAQNGDTLFEQAPAVKTITMIKHPVLTTTIRTPPCGHSFWVAKTKMNLYPDVSGFMVWRYLKVMCPQWIDRMDTNLLTCSIFADSWRKWTALMSSFNVCGAQPWPESDRGKAAWYNDISCGKSDQNWSSTRGTNRDVEKQLFPEENDLRKKILFTV